MHKVQYDPGLTGMIKSGKENAKFLLDIKLSMKICLYEHDQNITLISLTSRGLHKKPAFSEALLPN